MEVSHSPFTESGGGRAGEDKMDTNNIKATKVSYERDCVVSLSNRFL